MESDFFCYAIEPRYGFWGGKITEKRVPGETKNPPTSFRIKSIDLNNQGAKLFLSGNYEEALEAFENSLASGLAEVTWFNKANTLGKLGRYEESIKAFNRAIELNPTRSESVNLRDMAINLKNKTKK